MGCDIHAAIEVRGFADEPWTFVAEPPTYRNYAFFGALAGVRHAAENPLAAGRGIPKDISPDAAKRCNGDHSASWCTLQELRAGSEAMRRHMTEVYPTFIGKGGMLDQWLDVGDIMDAAHAYYGGDENDGSRTRFVFNFDS